jgi:glycosyltransferase involved in cell wall biosynthesis
VGRVRVALITEQLLAPVPGGIGRYSAELAAALVRRAGPDDAVDGWTAWHRDVRAATVDRLGGPRRLPVGRRLLAAAWERGLGPVPRGAELVHAPSALAPPPRGRPLVVSVHDTVPWTHPQTLTPHGARWHRSMVLRAVRAGASIAVLTRVVGEQLQQLVPGLPPDRVRVLGAGVSESLLAEPDAEQVRRVRRRFGLPDRFLLTLATLEPRKGLDVLVAALGRLGPGAPPLLVAGQPGWGGIDLAASAAAAGLAPDAVRALGRVADGDLAVLLRAATVLISPSRAEGFGLPVAEAMAVGTPVICSDAPALLEVVGDAALVVPRGDDDRLAAAVEALLADGSWQRRLALAGRGQARGYRWDAVAERAWRLYRDVVAAAGR